MSWLATVFAVGWLVTLVLWIWERLRWSRRRAADLRLLRHMAEGQAELQRELLAVRASREVN